MKIEYKLTRCGVARVLVLLTVFLLTFGSFIPGCKSNNNSLLTLKNVTGAFEKDGLRLVRIAACLPRILNTRALNRQFLSWIKSKSICLYMYLNRMMTGNRPTRTDLQKKS